MAVGVLLAVAAVAYFLTNWNAGGPAVAGVKGESKGSAPAAAAKGGPGGPGGPTPVEVVVVQPSAVQEDLQAVGSLRSNESVVLRPEVSGRIATIGFRDGQVVKKGQLLIGLDATLNEAEVAQYRAEYDLALFEPEAQRRPGAAEIHQSRAPRKRRRRTRRSPRRA